MRHPELEQLYKFSLKSEDLVTDRRAAEILNEVNKNWEKENREKESFYNAEEKKFIKLCLDYNSNKGEQLKEKLEEQYKRLA